jgi:hydrogenase maturation protease
VTHIICFGNLWAGDDGVGIHLYQELCQQELPPTVRLFEAGLLGLSALGCFDGCHKAIVVDAVRGEEQAGTALRLTPEQLACHTPPTAHGLGVDYLLRVLPIAFAGTPLPEVVMVGVAITSTRQADNTLSAPVEAAIPRAMAIIFQEISLP